MTAVGLFCRYFMGQDPKEKHEIMDRGSPDLLLKQAARVHNEDDGVHRPLLLVLRQLRPLLGQRFKYWKQWEKKLKTPVVDAAAQGQGQLPQGLLGSQSAHGATKAAGSTPPPSTGAHPRGVLPLHAAWCADQGLQQRMLDRAQRLGGDATGGPLCVQDPCVGPRLSEIGEPRVRPAAIPPGQSGYIARARSRMCGLNL